MIAFAVLLAAQPISQRHIDTLTDAELCQAFREIAAQPTFQIKDVGPFDFQEWQVDCGVKQLRVPAEVHSAWIDEAWLEERFKNAPFCRADNIQRFLQRGWTVQVSFRWIDGRIFDIDPCRQSDSTIA